MAKHHLHSLTPLGAKEPVMVEVAGTKITEMVDIALASIAARYGHEADCQNALAKMIGAPAPDVGKISGSGRPGGDVAAFWTGPDQWFVQAPFGEYEEIAALCAAEFGPSASVVELTDGWCRFALAGPDMRRVLSLLCAIDIRGLAPGDASRTVIEHVGCFVLCTAPDEVHILGPRSSAGSLHHALIAAAKSAPY